MGDIIKFSNRSQKRSLAEFLVNLWLGDANPVSIREPHSGFSSLLQFRGDEGETARLFETIERKIACSASFLTQEVPDQIVRSAALLREAPGAVFGR